MDELQRERRRRWREKNEAHENGPRCSPEELRSDVEALTRSDLESRVRVAGHLGVENARKVVAEAALAWAKRELEGDQVRSDRLADLHPGDCEVW